MFLFCFCGEQKSDDVDECRRIQGSYNILAVDLHARELLSLLIFAFQLGLMKLNYVEGFFAILLLSLHVDLNRCIFHVVF